MYLVSTASRYSSTKFYNGDSKDCMPKRSQNFRNNFKKYFCSYWNLFLNLKTLHPWWMYSIYIKKEFTWMSLQEIVDLFIYLWKNSSCFEARTHKNTSPCSQHIETSQQPTEKHSNFWKDTKNVLPRSMADDISTPRHSSFSSGRSTPPGPTQWPPQLPPRRPATARSSLAELLIYGGESDYLEPRILLVR